MNESAPPSLLRRALFKGGVVLLLLVMLYALMFYRSLRQVDAFCSHVTTDTDVSALAQIAKDLGVKLRGPAIDASSSTHRVFALVASPMTMGDYACTVDAPSMSGKVASKRLGY